MLTLKQKKNNFYWKSKVNRKEKFILPKLESELMNGM